MKERPILFSAPMVRASHNASKGPTSTFICALCGQFRGMYGKKFSHMEGRRQRFKCAVCVGEGK